MTNKNYKTQANRDGITLLFVISMVVLFLLMGTTFMLVSNDYYKSARSRADAVSYQVDSTALLDRCFYDLVRGPALGDASSPLRGHSILADQYGYGIKAELYAGPAGTGPLIEVVSGPFVTLSLSAVPTAGAPSLGTADAMRLVRNPTVVLDPFTDATMTAATGSTYVDGLYAGRVLSITSGALKGFSSRIISHTLVPGTGGTANNRMTVVVLASGLNWAAVADDDEVVINGADFSGRGAGDLTAFGGTLAALEMYDPDTIGGGLGANSSLVNQQAVPLSPDGTGGVNTNVTGYLASDQSTNESYDIPDPQNLFLGGTDAAGNPIPSFHRDTILLSEIPGGAPTSAADATARANLLRQSTLRPIYIRDFDGQPLFGEIGFPPAPGPSSTANFDFFENSLPELLPGDSIDTVGPVGANGTLTGAFAANAIANLDVDSDGDGVLDSVWIDIGLPAQTDSEGRTFKPLVAYRVVDMDGRINLNTSGSVADSLTPAAAGLRGGGYGVAEITPRTFVTSYADMLNARYQSTQFLDSPTPPDAIPGVERDGDNILATGNHLGRNQKLIGYPAGAYDAGDSTLMLNGSFGSGLDLFGQLQLQTVLPTGVTIPNTLPEFGIPTTTLTSAISPYQVNLGLSGSSLDNLFTPQELEGVLRADDADGSLLPTRLRDLVSVTPDKRNSVTTHSFEITLPATTGSLVRKLNNLLAVSVPDDPAMRATLVNGLLSQHVLLGGKVDINRALGNGFDDDGDGVVDNESLLATPVEEPTKQYGTGAVDPVADLDQGGDEETGDGSARQILAQDLYITALLACGENAPLGLALTSGPAPAADLVYRQMIAQWAINVVDFRDPDSIMTQFNYDPTPFDGLPWAPTAVVWGAERPELLLTETFAYHDRRTQDLDAGGGKTEDTDDDWDSGQVPQSGAFFELYHPWGQVNDITRSIPADFDDAVDGNGDPAPTGVNLGLGTPNDDPVWRLAFKRARSDAAFARAVYFYEVDTTRPSLIADLAGGDYFFTTLGTKTVAPGEHAVIGSSGNVGSRNATGGLMGPRYETTFGRLSASSAAAVTDTDISTTRAIALDLVGNRVIRRDGTGAETADEDGDGDPTNELVKTIAINSPRSLSISDPTGGYATALAAAGASTAGSGDGQMILPIMDTPLDASAAASDVDAIWTNGVTDNFRFAYLQRLANPLLDHNLMTNPYLTIDTAGVDLLAFNGMTTGNSDNGSTAEVYVDGGAAKAVIDGGTFVKSVERGESKHDAVVNATVPRQNLFASEEGNRIVAGTDGTVVAGGTHNLNYAFTETFGGFNNSYTANTDGGAGATTPFGWLTWNNRPFASAQEVANVPFHSSEWLCYYFNQGAIDGMGNPADATNLKPTGELVGNHDIDGYELTAFFGNTDQFHKHLLRFGQNNEVTAAFGALTAHPMGTTITAAVGTTNRMVNIFDYIEVPNKFLGSETFLPIDAAGNSLNGGTGFGFEVPFHGVPNFRAPGKININTINDQDVWDAIFGYTPAAPLDFATFNLLRGSTSGPTDFGGVFTSSEGSQFASHASTSPAAADSISGQRGENASGTLFQLTGSPPVSAFDGIASTTAPIKDTVGSPYFRNEIRQRLGSMVTTRSSVFSIWITVGYFELDDFGRIGAELGSLEGQVTRNRAYYMYDRSIPVAFEPGKDHNVDNGVLVRTIIQ